MIKLATNTVLALVKIVLVAFALVIASDYVAQGRFAVMGNKPCGSSGVCVLIYDNRYGEFFWQPLPEAPARDIVPN